jgi:FMN phosphatase YigB (HAD superfamily)
MRIQAIAFDLGNTLVEYYQREAFPSILSESIRNAHTVLSNFATEELEGAQVTALLENKEQPDGKVRPLQERLDRVFGLMDHTPIDIRQQACLAFMQPIFKCARKYQDTIPTLQTLRQQGYKLVSCQTRHGEAQVNCGARN